VRLNALSQELDAMRQQTVAAPPPPTDPAIVPPQPGTPVGTVPAPAIPAAPPSSAGVSPTRLYETAWADYTAGQLTLAIQGFETFIKMFPKSDLADDAQQYIGES